MSKNGSLKYWFIVKRGGKVLPVDDKLLAILSMDTEISASYYIEDDPDKKILVLFKGAKKQQMVVIRCENDTKKKILSTK